MPNNFLDFSNEALNKLDNFINNKKNNSIIDNFLHELQNHFTKLQSSSLVQNLPSNTILTFAKYEGNFAQCFDYNDKKIYYLPKDSIIGSKPETGDALKWYSSGKFYVDYTGIPAEKDKIDTYLKECTIAK